MNEPNKHKKTGVLGSLFSDPEVESFDQAVEKQKGQGFTFKDTEFIHHSNLPQEESAFFRLLVSQRWAILAVGFVFLLLLSWNWHGTLLVTFSALTGLYFLDLLFNAYLIYRSFAKNPAVDIPESETEKPPAGGWPSYTVLCPLYKEAHILPQFVQAMSELSYPKNKLQIILLFEEDDQQSIFTAAKLNLPKNFQVVVIPPSQPRTKPKAMNYGLKFTTGEYLVVYDAEDVPDPLQLKKAIRTFERLGEETVCVQAKLNFYNPKQNLLTRIFTAEYSLWFDLVLTGLQSVGAPIPLGGTSNHFKTQKLKELGGWDAFNVTEDCDLGLRLSRYGYQTAMVESITLEEANSGFVNWYRQRSRWIKGYIQTYLVHMRRPAQFVKTGKLKQLAMFQLTVGGKILSLFINPLMWLITFAYFAFRAKIGLFIESFFPTTILYIGVASLIFGNFLYLYYYMVGCAKRGNWGLIKYVYLVPLYWLYMSAAAWQALYEMIVKPHYWAKTLHGLHLGNDKSDKIDTIGETAPLSEPKQVFDWSEQSLTEEQLTINDLQLTDQDKILQQEPSVIINEPLIVNPDAAVRTGSHSLIVSPAAPSALERIREFFSSNVGSGTVLVISSLVANFLNFLFNAVLGRALTLEDFATVTLFNTVLNVLAVALGALGSAVTYRTAFLHGQENTALATKFFGWTKKYVWLWSGLLSLAWLAFAPLFANYFKVNNFALVAAFTPVLALGNLAAVQNGFLRGGFKFTKLGQAIVLEALSKLVFAVLFLWQGNTALASLSIPLSIVVSYVASLWFSTGLVREEAADVMVLKDNISAPSSAPFRASASESRNLLNKENRSLRSASDALSLGRDGGHEIANAVGFPFSYFGAAVLTSLSGAAFLNIDVLLAKHFLTDTQAGAYALLSLSGKMVYFLGTLLTPFISATVSKHEGAGTSAKEDFGDLFFGTVAFSAFAFAVFGLFGKLTIPLLFGDRASAVVPFLPAYALAMALFAVSGSVVSYHITKKHFSFSYILLFSASLLLLGITVNHAGIEDFTAVMLSAAVVSAGLVFFAHLLWDNSSFLARNITDFLGAFTPLPANPARGGKRILVFNWRDTKHSYAGGAEVYIHELAKRWVEAGNSVTLFCGNDQQCQRLETVDGVQIVRRGGFYTVYLWAFIYYILQFRGRYDVLVDCQNGVPFFTPLFAKEKVVAVLHHIHQDVFYKYLPQALAFVAATLEKRVMPFVYRKTRFMTVSNSSKEEMQKLGIGRVGIDVVYPGVDLDFLQPGEKYKDPIVLYLGRLKPYKAVDTLIEAFYYVVAQVEKARLVIAGDGEERSFLKRLAESLGLKNRVIFTGKVSEDEKLELLQKSWVFVNPSFMEGWGITSIEANACGVPVVASNVPGLRESVQNPHTGYLVPHGSPEKFAEKIQEILLDQDLQNFMSNEALSWAQNFSWKKSAEKSLEVLNAK